MDAEKWIPCGFTGKQTKIQEKPVQTVRKNKTSEEKLLAKATGIQKLSAAEGTHTVKLPIAETAPGLQRKRTGHAESRITSGIKEFRIG